MTADDGQFDLFALNPTILEPFDEDQADDRTGFYGLIADWRRWSEVITLGYAHFIPGGFTERSGRPDDTDFFYVETLVSLFR